MLDRDRSPVLVFEGFRQPFDGRLGALCSPLRPSRPRTKSPPHDEEGQDAECDHQTTRSDRALAATS